MARHRGWPSLAIAVLVLLAGCLTGVPATSTESGSPTPALPESPTSTATLPGTSTLASTASATASQTTGTPPRSERTEFRVTVVRIVDGDTIEVRFRNGDIEDVRLLGVDTPEVHTDPDPPEWEGIPDTVAGRDHLRSWGEMASSFAASRLELGEEIRLVVDAQADRRGSFGRLLVYVYDDGVLFNLLLLEQGYARLYDSPFSKRAEFASVELAARDGNVGVWDFGSSTPTESSALGTLAVVEIHEDATGNDHENENDEYVAFQNTGDSELDMTGWRVEDEAGHTYRFPSGFTLEAGAKVVLRTGSGTDTESTLYWGSDSAIWNNGGDTVIVYDDGGKLVTERSYG